MNDEIISVTFLVVEVLEKLGVQYLIGGSFASGVHGEPRFTRDADLLADIKSEHIEPLCDGLTPEFNITKEAIQNALRYRSSFGVIISSLYLRWTFLFRRIGSLISSNCSVDVCTCLRVSLSDAHMSQAPKTRFWQSWIGTGSGTKFPISNGATYWASSKREKDNWMSIT